jgi:hypothetical protein
MKKQLRPHFRLKKSWPATEVKFQIQRWILVVVAGEAVNQ